MKKKLLFNFVFYLFSCSLLQAQVYTETFEGVTGPGKPTLFINNGQSFTATTATPGATLGGLFGVYIPLNTWTMPNPGGGSTNNGPGGFGVGTSCTSGNCTGVSDKFLDNGSSLGVSQVYSIKTTDSHTFSIKNIQLFFSSDHGNTNNAPTSVIINGKKAGVTVFTINKVSGFITGFAMNNGFNYINFATEGGVDHSNASIDEIEFKCAANVNYFAVDNFTWSPVSIVLPVQLEDFSGSLHNNIVSLNWHTGTEINTNRFELQWSKNALDWQTINSQLAKGNKGIGGNNYSYAHNDIADLNFYRLLMIDNNGKFTISKILNLSKKSRGEITFYPNPVTDKLVITLPNNEIAYARFINSNGQVIKTMQLNKAITTIDINDFKRGVYTIRIIQGALIKTEKIIKQ